MTKLKLLSSLLCTNDKTTHMLTWSLLCPAWMLSLRIIFIRLKFVVERLHLSVVHLHTNQPLVLASGVVNPETRISLSRHLYRGDSTYTVRLLGLNLLAAVTSVSRAR